MLSSAVTDRMNDHINYTCGRGDSACHAPYQRAKDLYQLQVSDGWGNHYNYGLLDTASKHMDAVSNTRPGGG